ncbi:protein of unknown function [Candidatus Nitrosocosmicus franklandus]|uniref:Uncharacterized protein n=1 Tax=Candidatus Nitrosocosmicus franklandianus TaxID=1798806 RepID=A0A484IBB0_9ARCH|nr:protein of unknown function [Candidatus Nitrosocosmicus franklandus]
MENFEYIPRFMNAIKRTEGKKDLSSIFLATFGILSFTTHPANKGKKRASANRIIISIRGIWNFSVSIKKYTNDGRENGTTIDDDIIIPTTNGN